MKVGILSLDIENVREATTVGSSWRLFVASWSRPMADFVGFSGPKKSHGTLIMDCQRSIAGAYGC